MRQFMSFLSIALSHAGIEICGSTYYHIVVSAEEYYNIGQDGSKLKVRVWEDVQSDENHVDSYLNQSAGRSRSLSDKLTMPA